MTATVSGNWSPNIFVIVLIINWIIYFAGPNLRRSDSVSSNHSTLDGRWSPTSQQTTSNSLYDALRGGPGPFLDSVQSQLKLKDGEVQHLKSELRQLELTRQKLSEEMLRNTEIAEEVTKLRGEINSLKTSNEVSRSWAYFLLRRSFLFSL